MKREIPIAWLFFLTAGVSMVAAFVPMFKGGALSVIFFATGVLWFIFGLAAVKKARKSSGKEGP